MHRDLTTIAAELAANCAVTAGSRECGLLKALEQDEHALLRHARGASARAVAVLFMASTARMTTALGATPSSRASSNPSSRESQIPSFG